MSINSEQTFNKVMIDNQFIGKINGLKLELDLKKNALETDIKSLKKAARQGISNELIKRAKEIIEKRDLELKDDYKVYWKSNPIAKIKKGRILIVKRCNENWCQIKTSKFKGWIKITNIWGEIK